MEVTLTGELEAFIQEKVRSGRYADASDVVRDALRTLEQKEEFESPDLEAALLEGVRSPHHAFGAETLERIRRSASQGGHSVLDIPTASVGRILRPFPVADDLLGEMLDDR